MKLSWRNAIPEEDGNQFRANLTVTNQEPSESELLANPRTDLVLAFMKNSPNMIWIINEGFELVYANKVLLKYFQLDRTALKVPIQDSFPGPVIDSLYQQHLDVLRTGNAWEFFEEDRSADGKSRTFRINLFLAGTEPGKRLVAGIATDITERKTLENNLDEAWERISQLSAITSDAIWEWDMQTGEIIRNQTLMELIGYHLENDHGITWWLGRIHPEDRERLNEVLKDITDKGLKSWKCEYRFLCADGEYKNILDKGFVMHKNGMPVRMIGSLHDITDEKLMQNLLLEEKVRQCKVLSENTIKVQEQERSRFGRELHDNVNQILSAVHLYIGMLNPTNDGEIEIKQKALDYSIMAIEEIRKLSREMVTPQLQGGLLIENIKRIIGDMERTTGIRVKFTHDQETGLLSPGKKLALFRIIQEQVKNIIRYSKATDVEILLQCGHGTALLTIKDNGQGFDVKKTRGGVGLLSMQERARFYNGTTEIIAAPGEGTMIMTRIPLTENPQI